jgi:hypothetical protein
VSVFYDNAKLARIGADIVCVAGQPETVPLFNAIEDRHLVFYVATERTERLPLQRLTRARLPILILLADSDGGEHGPDAWRCTDEALGWANLVWSYGWRLPRDGYEALVVEAVDARRMLLVETPGPFVNVGRRRVGGELVAPMVASA